MSTRVLAVDLGAASVRVAAVDLEGEIPEVEVVHRWHHGPTVATDGTLRWDWPRIVEEVETGLEKGLADGPIASIGVDGWGVDYGLVDRAGNLIALPYSYRDGRTDGWHGIAQRIGIDQLYAATGIQLMAFNTVFQLAVHDRSELSRASRILLLPDLMVHHLVGFEGAERSNASTTGLMNGQNGEWSSSLIEAIDLDRSLFPEVVPARERAGTWHGVPVHLVGSHDTASAFLGMPGGSDPGTAFVSTGTWVIVGMERSEFDTSDAARRANFSNEAGALGGFRFLKNVVGFWILEQCRAGWGDTPIDLLLEEASAVTESVALFDAGDHRFLNPSDMEQEVRAAAGLDQESDRSVVTRSIIESISQGIGRVVGELSEITGNEVTQLALVGGGRRVPILAEVLSSATGLRVIKGSPEATALGNAVVQGLALGHFDDAADARAWAGATGEAA